MPSYLEATPPDPYHVPAKKSLKSPFDDVPLSVLIGSEQGRFLFTPQIHPEETDFPQK
jgi:hypothetical protein